MHYSQCYIDSAIISFGRTINSISGAFNTGAAFVMYALNNYDVSNPDSDIKILNDFANSGDAMNFGKTLASIIKTFFNIEVPDAQYGSV